MFNASISFEDAITVLNMTTTTAPSADINQDQRISKEEFCLSYSQGSPACNPEKYHTAGEMD